MIFHFYHTFKDSSRGDTGRTFFYRTFFKVSHSKKIRNLQSFFLILSGSVAFFYETLKTSYFFMKPFFAMRNFKKAFVEEGSSHVSAGRIFKSLVERKNHSLSISSHLNTISNLSNFLEGFGKVLIFFRV